MKRERKLYKNRKVKIEYFAPHPQVFHFIPLIYHFIPLRYPRIAKLSTVSARMLFFKSTRCAPRRGAPALLGFCSPAPVGREPCPQNPVQGF